MAMARRWNKEPWKNWPRWNSRPPVHYIKPELDVVPEGPTESSPTQGWFELRVVQDADETAVPYVPLEVKSSSGSVQKMMTSAEGRVRVNGLDDETCEVSTSAQGAKLAQSAEVVGTGASSPRVKGEKGTNGAKGGARSGASRVKHLIAVERHRVRTGETLESIAKAAGMSWQELAEFNWSTSEPEEINKHLAHDIGCTKVTRDGKNFMLDDSDQPGIILVPRPWREAMLPVKVQNILRVRPVRPLGFVHIRLHVDPQVAPGQRFRLFSTDGSYEQVMTAADDVNPDDGAENLDLMFTGCPVDLRYSLEILTKVARGSTSEFAFEDVSYDELTEDAGEDAGEGDDGASDEDADWEEDDYFKQGPSQVA